MNANNNPLVYSTDDSANKRCPKCRRLASECVCSSDAPIPAKITAVLRLEKAHRGGKVVTVVDRLPKSETLLKDLAAKLKKKCGCGGTYRMEGEFGVVEIQGDRLDLLRVELPKNGIRCKG